MFARHARNNIAGHNDDGRAFDLLHDRQFMPHIGQQRLSLVRVAHPMLQSSRGVEGDAKFIAFTIGALELVF